VAISQWQFVKDPTPEFRNRYLLKLTGSREDIVRLYKKHTQFLWVPCAVRGEEYSWGVYVDTINSEDMEALKDYLGSVTHPDRKKASPQEPAPQEKPTDKLEIIGSTWDWQKMQMGKRIDGTKPPEHTEEKPPKKEKKEKKEIEKQSPETEQPPPVAKQKESSAPEKLEQEGVYEPKKEDVEVNEIISELNTILSAFAKSDGGQRSADKEKTESAPEQTDAEKFEEPFSPEVAPAAAEEATEPEAEAKVPSPEEAASEIKKDITPAEDPVPELLPEPVSEEHDRKPWEELSDMLVDNEEDKKSSLEKPALEEQPPTLKPPEPSPKPSEPAPEPPPPEPVEEQIPEHVESLIPSLAKPAKSDPSTIRIAAIAPDGDKEITEIFSASITESLSKISKGKLNADIVLSLAINGDAFDPQEVFGTINGHNADMVFLLGLEKASTYKIGQLLSLLDSRHIEKKSIAKKLISKKFTYLDVSAELMIMKRKIIDEGASD